MHIIKYNLLVEYNYRLIICSRNEHFSLLGLFFLFENKGLRNVKWKKIFIYLGFYIHKSTIAYENIGLDCWWWSIEMNILLKILLLFLVFVCMLSKAWIQNIFITKKIFETLILEWFGIFFSLSLSLTMVPFHGQFWLEFSIIIIIFGTKSVLKSVFVCWNKFLFSQKKLRHKKIIVKWPILTTKTNKMVKLMFKLTV